jgi:hypothetical protein
MGTGIKSEATAKSEKKANTIMPFTFISTSCQEFLDFFPSSARASQL